MRSTLRPFFLCLILLISPIPSSLIQATSATSSPHFPITLTDHNGNGIDDALDSSSTPLTNVIVHLDSSTIPIQLRAYSIKYVFQSINAVKLVVNKSDLKDIIKIPGVTYIEKNRNVQPYLLDSTAQMGLPDSFWASGITGSSRMSVAILDSGIDATQSAFKGRIIASYNAISQNTTAPVDNIGHGTHVAGIVAANLPFNGTYHQSQRGTLPTDCDSTGCPLNIDIRLPNISQGQKVHIVMDWANSGQDYPGTNAGFVIFDPLSPNNNLACTNCFVNSTSGKLDTTLTLDKGSYLLGTFSVHGAKDQNYDIGLQYDKTGTTGSGAAARGVAYNSKIIPVKVSDSINGGNLEIFDRAINWVINHRLQYNITVVNLSLGVDQYSSTLDNMMKTLVDHGILPVVAAGNAELGSNGIFSPASAPEALTVGAINDIGEIAYYTNVGSKAVNGLAPKPDVLAPGGSAASKATGFVTSDSLGFGLIPSADANIGLNVFKNDLTGYQGTSMAAPHISGLAALIASQIQATTGWNWSSRSSVMEVKRMIQAGTFEVGNIGVGREYKLGTNSTSPPINRNSRDFQEGWGAVDSRAILGMLQHSISVGYQKTLNFQLNKPNSQKTYGWKMTLQKDTNYGFTLDVPSTADMDIKIIRADQGPLLNGKDYGELQILASTSQGMGKKEGIALNVNATTQVYVIATIVNGDGPQQANFAVSKLGTIPSIDITSPFDGQQVENPVTIEFQSIIKTVDLYIDGAYIAQIQSGYQLDHQLTKGDHQIKLVGTANNGITATAISNFKVVEHVTTNGFLSFPLYTFMLSTMMIALWAYKRFSNKIKR